jgi:hypothetical protein
MRLTLHLDESDSVRQQLARDLAVRLSREEGVEAKPAQAAAARGTKGDPVTIGTIIISALGSGGVIAALLGVLKSYIERHPKIRFELERDGQKIVIAAEDLTPEQLAGTNKLIDKLLRPAK